MHMFFTATAGGSFVPCSVPISIYICNPYMVGGRCDTSWEGRLGE